MRIKYEPKNKTVPIIAHKKVDLAFATFSASPPEIKYITDPLTNMINKIRTTKPEDNFRMFWKMTSKHLSVGMPSTIHPGASPAR